MNLPLKLIHEVVYFMYDHRATATAPLAAQGFVIDGENGDTLVSGKEGDTLTFSEKRKDLPDVAVTVYVPRGNFLYRMERKFLRKRHKHETE